MLKNSRVSGILDVARLGAALRGPGMDTRTWVSLGVVLAVHLDADEGLFADVMLVPLEIKVTARVGSEYAGPGYGLYSPIYVDDEVLVEAPSGNPDHGMVITRRLWSASDPPPSEAVANPEDVLLVVRKGQTLRLITKGGGNVIVQADGEVQLGDEGATLGVARETDEVLIDLAKLQQILDLRYMLLPASPPIPMALPAAAATLAPPLQGAPGTITSASSKVKAT